MSTVKVPSPGLGERIRRSRNEIFATSTDIAAHTTIAANSLSPIERGAVTPSTLVLWELAQYLQIDYLDLLELADRTAPDPDSEDRRAVHELPQILAALATLDHDELRDAAASATAWAAIFKAPKRQ